MRITTAATRILIILSSIALIPSSSVAQQQFTVQEESHERGTATSLVTIDQLVEEALGQNPEIRAARREVDMKRARIPQAGALPDPTVNFGQMNVGNLIPFTTLGEEGFSEIYVGFSQEFPFYGERGLRERIAASEAEAEWWTYEFTRRRVIAQVKVAYYDLFYWRKALAIVRKNIDLLDKFADIAEALYRVGKGNQADVLRAQTEISRLHDRREVIEQRASVAEARLNALLNRPPDRPIGQLAPVEKVPLRYALQELTRMAVQNFPLLKQQQRLIDRSEFSVRLAKKEMYPDFGIVFAYHNRGGITDYWTIGGTAKIPLYFWRKQRPAIAEAAASLAAARQRYESALALLFFRLKDQYLAATTADRLTTLYGETVLPQETLTLEATVASYQVGKLEFLSVLDSLMKLLNDELNYWENLVNYQKALVQIELFVGTRLTR